MDIDTKYIKSHVNIIDYVNQYYPHIIKFEEVNGSYCKAKCIWHTDNETPSLTFFNNGTYKCFGCGKHGDIITLVQTLENTDFQTACKIIGDNIGYEVNITPPNIYYEEYKDNMEKHVARYQSNYEKDLVAQDYLENKRKLTKETIKEFRLGVTDIYEYKYRKEISSISHRISFPILEPKSYNAKCLAMGYRTIFDEKPKYINDHNQDGRNGQNQNYNGVFTKGNCLFGYTNAYKWIKVFKCAVLTEGYMDVLSLYQSGIKNCVSLMGTALTDQQILLLKKITNNIILLLDSDSAGVNAMIKYVPSLIANNFNVRICNFNNGMDPADICIKYDFNYNTINSLIIQNSIDAEQYIINDAVKEYEKYTYNKRKEIIQNIIPFINSIPNEINRNICLNELNKRLDIR